MKKLSIAGAALLSFVSFAEGKKAEPAKAAPAAAPAAVAAPKDIIDTAVAAGSFKTLATVASSRLG